MSNLRVDHVIYAVDEQSLRSGLGDFDFELRVIDGPPGLSAVAISTDADELVLR